jgi:hypothetical protein
MTYRTQGRAGLRELWRRTVDVRRIDPRWYAVIFVLVPAITTVAMAVDAWLDSSGQLDFQPMLDYLTHP